MSAALFGFCALLTLILLRLPLALAMGLVGFFGFAVLLGLGWDNFFDFNWKRPLSAAAQTVASTAMSYELSVIPLFVLMGNLIARAGIAKQIYDASHAFLAHRKGGLASATIVACGGFSAICGSSLATAATMSKVAIAPMRKFGYDDSLSTAAIAAGGTLGILIPPSIILVIYGLLTETSIRELFAAGFLPGLVGILFYIGAVRWTVWRRPAAAPAVAERMRWKNRLRHLTQARGALVLFFLVMGGIYGGVFTPTEAAGIGAIGAFFIALSRRTLSWQGLREALQDSATTSAALFSTIIGALVFSLFINRTGMPNELAAMIQEMQAPPYVALAAILLIYIVLGMVFESLSMLLLTVPVFFPLIIALGFDPVWFGVIAVVVTEISLITPPVGLNVFVLASTIEGVSARTVFRGVTPFWIADIFRLLLLVAFPAVSLFLPQLFYH